MKPLYAILGWQGDRMGIEGSWSGNDTVWRMSLDLNRILLYGRQDGTLASEPQRKLFHISDAIIAGQGSGPLSPQAFELGLLLASENPAAMDVVGAELLRLNSEVIPIVRRCFDSFRWPIVGFAPDEVMTIGEDNREPISEFVARLELPIPEHFPAGWYAAARSVERPANHSEI
jgi:hypothetical protein